MIKKVIFLLVIGSMLFTLDAFGQGCSQCKMLAEQSSELDEASFGSNINMGILYLMAIPYILLFVLFRKRIFSFARSLKKVK
jgi:hypothetical protein